MAKPVTYNFKKDLKLFVDLAHGRLNISYHKQKTIDNLFNTFNDLKKFVKYEWAVLSNQDKQLISAAAYDVLAEEERLPMFRPLYWYQLSQLKGFKRKATVQVVLKLHQDCLDEILSQIERDDPRFQAELEESLNQAIEYLNNNK